MSPNLFALVLLPKIAYFLPACANLPPSLIIPSLYSDSAIGLQFLQNSVCAQHYDDSRFSILAKSRSSFYLSVLEATFIKTSNHALCRQKEFVYSLNIVH